MKKFQPWQGARCTVHPTSAKRLYSNVVSLHEMGFNQFIIGPALSPKVEWHADSIADFAMQIEQLVDYYLQMRQKKQHFRLTMLEFGGLIGDDLGVDGAWQIRHEHVNSWGCGAARGRITVSTSGELYGCSRLMAANSSGERKLGWIGNIWKGFDTKARARYSAANPAARTQCLKCDLRDDCTGGCPAVNHLFTGNIYEPCKVDCRFTRIYVEAKQRAFELQPASADSRAETVSR